MNPVIEILFDEEIQNYTDYIAHLRMEAFKPFPYLYAGNLEYERTYIRGYQFAKKAMLATANIDGNIVGISTGIPLNADSEIVSGAKEAFEKENINVEDYYYYGEIIILPEYRGLGLAKKLYEAQDIIVRRWGYRFTSILTVVREADHPLKPQSYQPTDKLWERLGFCWKGLEIAYHWPTIQADRTVKEQKHSLEFWIKNLQR